MNERWRGGLSRWLIMWAATAVAIMLSAYIFPGVVLHRVYLAVLAALVLSCVSFVLEPVLYLLTLPINVATLGLFSTVLDGVVLVVASALVPGFYFTGRFHGIGWAILTSVVIELTRAVMKVVVRRARKNAG